MTYDPVEVKMTLSDIERVRDQARSEGYRDGDQHGSQVGHTRGRGHLAMMLRAEIKKRMVAGVKALEEGHEDTDEGFPLDELLAWLDENDGQPKPTVYAPRVNEVRQDAWYRHGDEHDDPGGPCAECERLDAAFSDSAP